MSDFIGNAKFTVFLRRRQRTQATHWLATKKWQITSAVEFSDGVKNVDHWAVSLSVSHVQENVYKFFFKFLKIIHNFVLILEN